jgi:RNA polymerase sigma-70 factor (ECF subfamily)
VRTLVSQIVVSESAWEDSYERSFAQVFRGLMALGARPDEAEDALHDAFIRGFESGDIASPAGWLFGVASRLWRRRRWGERLFRPFIRQKIPSAADALSRIRLFDVLRRLPSRQREVLVALYIVGLSREETARALGIARGTVVATSTQAAEALRVHMGTSMSEELERWTMREFDEAAVRITLPPRDRWIRQERKSSGTKAAAVLALAGLALVGILVFAEPSRTNFREPPATPAPTTFSRNDSGTPLPTEAEVWGGIWSQAKGVAVLRPGWLPKGKDEYQVFFSASTSSSGFMQYSVSYYEPRSVPGTVVWNIEFLADSLEAPGRGLQQFGGLPETLTMRGHAAELYGNGSPGWTLVWSDGNYRYAIQASAVSREDLMRIADSLAPVIDGTGRTTLKDGSAAAASEARARRWR